MIVACKSNGSKKIGKKEILQDLVHPDVTGFNQHTDNEVNALLYLFNN